MTNKRTGRLPAILDGTFFFIALFSLSFVWAQFFIKIRPLSFAFSVAVSLSGLLLVGFFSRRKKTRLASTALEKRRFERVLTQLLFSSNEKNMEFFHELLSKKYNAHRENSCIILGRPNDSESDNALDGHKTGITAVIPHFSHEPLSPQTLTEIIAGCMKFLPEKIFILTNSVSPKALELSLIFSSAKIIIKDANGVYDLLLKYDTFPDITISISAPKRTGGKLLISSALNRKRTKAYIFGAVVLSVFSFFTSPKALYLTFATICIILSFISFLNLDFTKPKPPKHEL